MAKLRYDLNSEWLEADGLGGFASGTVGGWRTRRYHALLLTAATPPTGRYVLVNGFDAWLETAAGRFDLTTQRYAPDALSPRGYEALVDFTLKPWPTWTWRWPNGPELTQELFVPRGRAAVALRWKLTSPGAATLQLRPFLSGRDYHALHHENPTFDFSSDQDGEQSSWQPYDDVPGVTAFANGVFTAEPLWYRQFLYTEERDRGLDHLEDLASPGRFTWKLGPGDAVLILATSSEAGLLSEQESSALAAFARLERHERERRAGLDSPLAEAAEAYLVQRGDGLSVIAGYPWFTDWGRDTFISLRGLCLAQGMLNEAGRILGAWAGHVSEGMLPNRFPDQGEAPEFNSVDASLWFIIAAWDYLEARRTAGQPAPEAEPLRHAIAAILAGYTQGTRYRIHADADGLLACGEPGVQLTWMDAKVGDWVVTPRIGKPVEVQALWLNALWIGQHLHGDRQAQFEQALASFRAKFWNAERRCLFDVVDADHEAGKNDPALRPNQIFAVGGLPLNLLPSEQAKAVVAIVEQELVTPMGLRTLGPKEPGYKGRYEGGPAERDGAYHQGTAWPWLMGAFVNAWRRVRAASNDVDVEVHFRFVLPLLQSMGEAGLMHVSEIADGDPPHTPRGCPFQAWSLGELLRMPRLLGAPTLESMLPGN